MKKLINIINPNAIILEDNTRIRPEKSEVNRLLGSNKKLKELTSWQSEYSLEQGLLKTIEWFKKEENLSKYKTNLYNI